MSPQSLAARMGNLNKLLIQNEKERIEVYQYLCSEKITPSQVLVFTETFKDNHKREDRLTRELSEVKKQLDVLAY